MMAASTTASPSPETTALVPLAEYLDTTYRPDCDWIDGEVRERNLGEQPHASVQGFFTGLFIQHGVEWGVRVFPEQRVQTSAEHYRVADVCVVRRELKLEPIVRTPPLLCIEILSRDDRMSEMQERVDDYFAMGVGNVWVVDPRRRRAYTADRTGGLEAAVDVLRIERTAIEARLSEVFSELDEMEQGL